MAFRFTMGFVAHILSVTYPPQRLEDTLMRSLMLALAVTALGLLGAPAYSVTNDNFLAIVPEDGTELRAEDFAGRSLAVFAFCRS